MALPAAVQKQVAQADDLIKKLGLDKAAEAKDQPPPAAPPAPVAAPAPAAQTPAQAATPDAAPAAEPPPPPPPPPPAEDWEHKYRVLQGKYNSEVPRLSGQVSSLQAQLDELTAKMEDMRKAAPPPAPTNRLITQEEVDEVGPELIDLIGRRAKEVYEPIVAELRQEVSSLKTQLAVREERDTRTERQKLIDRLAERVPNYAEVNKLPAFLDWLDQVDAYSGEQRGQMLTRAFEANDAERVIRFFTGFLSEHAAVSPQQAPTPGSQMGTPRVNLNEHIAPGTPVIVPPTSGAQGEKRIWRQSEISAFYASVARGDFKRRPDDQRRIESDIVAAGREGRIRS